MNLERFLIAQDRKTSFGTTVYEQSLIEIRQGNLKIHCWIRYIFPQMLGLGTSKVTNFYGINGREEAKAYIEHPILRERLINLTQAVMESEKNIYEILGIDAMRFRSCMLLFASVSDEPIFKKVIAQYNWK